MKFRPVQDAVECFGLSFREDSRFDVVGLGQNAVDHVLIVPELPRFDAKMEVRDYMLFAGGQIATALVCAGRMGLRVKYIGKVGADENGRFSRSSLAREPVDISSLRVAEGAANHCSFILVDQKSGERSILWHRDPRLNYRKGELLRSDVCSGRLLLLDGENPDSALEAALWAEEAGIPVVADLDAVLPGTRELIAHVDFLIASASFPFALTGYREPERSLAALRQYGAGFVAATQGAGGAVALIGDRCVSFPGFPVRTVDTTGAGDVFHGAFVYGLLRDWPVSRIMEFANAAAALNCTRLGAREGIASPEEIDRFISSAARR